MLVAILPVTFVSAQKTFAVRGVVMMTPQFCGGMKLTDEEMERYSPYPMKNKRMYIRTGDSNNIGVPVYKEFSTDSKGEFCVDLPPGTYVLFDSLKKDDVYIRSVMKQYPVRTKNYDAADKQCLRQWLSTPDIIVTIKNSDPEKVSIYYYEHCVWNVICVQYLGLPPS